MCTLSISNVIYHKFLHGATFYTLNGKNVNVMLELNNKRHFDTDFVYDVTCTHLSAYAITRVAI